MGEPDRLAVSNHPDAFQFYKKNPYQKPTSPSFGWRQAGYILYDETLAIK